MKIIKEKCTKLVSALVTVFIKFGMEAILFFLGWFILIASLCKGLN